jgi:predicted HD superfamily hydrolase involved in NAD metabolism
MRDQVLTWLADNVPASRLQHILGVEQMSVELARHYHLDVEKAAQAGLMHDLAKYFKPSVLLQMARDEGIEIDPICEATPHLLHADVSAIVAKEQFGMQDEEVMEAIAHHTLGRPGMSPLSCVVFLRIVWSRIGDRHRSWKDYDKLANKTFTKLFASLASIR